MLNFALKKKAHRCIECCFDKTCILGSSLRKRKAVTVVPVLKKILSWSVCLSVCICPFTCLSINLYVCRPFCLYVSCVCICFCLFVYPFYISLPVCHSVPLSGPLSFNLSLFYPDFSLNCWAHQRIYSFPLTWPTLRTEKQTTLKRLTTFFSKISTCRTSTAFNCPLFYVIIRGGAHNASQTLITLINLSGHF